MASTITLHCVLKLELLKMLLIKFRDPKLLRSGAAMSRSLSVIASVCQFFESATERGSPGWGAGHRADDLALRKLVLRNPRK